jgi:hypothetical protein
VDAKVYKTSLGKGAMGKNSVLVFVRAQFENYLFTDKDQPLLGRESPDGDS